jgi:hypothetical protein
MLRPHILIQGMTRDDEESLMMKKRQSRILSGSASGRGYYLEVVVWIAYHPLGQDRRLAGQ